MAFTDDLRVPEGLRVVHKAITGMLSEYQESSPFSKHIHFSDLGYPPSGGVKITVTITEDDKPRSGCVTDTFIDDFAHPNFFERLESFLNECVEPLKESRGQNGP